MVHAEGMRLPGRAAVVASTLLAFGACARSALDVPSAPPPAPDAGPTPFDAGRPDAGRPDAGGPDAGPDWLAMCEGADLSFLVTAGVPEPERGTLAFPGFRLPVDVERADVYFLFDGSFSMRPEQDAMRAAVVTIVNSLSCDGVPGEEGCVPSLWSGVGVYAGRSRSYRNQLSLQPDVLVTEEALEGLDGEGNREALFESVSCVADRDLCPWADCAGTGIGCPGYRRDALRILVVITDEPDQCRDCSPDTAAAAGGLLRDRRIVFVGIDADAGDIPRAHLEAIATRAGSTDSRGVPLVFDGDGEAVGEAVTRAIGGVLGSAPDELRLVLRDLDGDDGDALALVSHVEVDVSGSAECPFHSGTIDSDGDGLDDRYTSPSPDVPLCWTVVPIPFIASAPRARVLRAEAVVRAEDLRLAERQICFVIPPG